MWKESASSVHRFSIWVLLVSLITAALLSIGGRVLIGSLEYFKTDIEDELADYGISGVTLDSIKGGWQGFHPVLRIKGASLSVPGRAQALSINELELSVKLIPSLISADLQLKSFHTTVEKLILVHDEQGLWWLNDIALSPQSAEMQDRLDIYAFFERLPDTVTVDIQLLQIRDQFNDVEYLIREGQLSSGRYDQRLALSLTADLPYSLGRKFQLLMTGDAQNQQLYLDAEQLNMVNLLQLAGYPTESIKQANISIKSWMQLQGYQLKQVKNKARLTRVLLNGLADDKENAFINAAIVQNITRHDDAWRFETQVNQFVRGQQKLSGLNTQLLLEPGQSPLLWIDKINVADTLPIILPLIKSVKTVDYLKALEPQADIRNLLVEWNSEDPRQSLAGFKVSALQNKAYQSIPAVKGLDGNIVYARNNANILLQSANLVTDFSTLFRAPLTFDHFKAQINLSNYDDSVVLQANSLDIKNPDIQMQGRAWLEANDSGRPFLSLRTNYTKGKVAATSKYLPVTIMGENTVAWLDRAIKDGQIPSGDLLFHGRLQRISELERDSSGEFHARFEVQDPQVKFLEAWPEARQGNGLASFHNTAMDLYFKNVQIAASRVNQVDLSIPNLLRSELYIKAETATRADNLVESLTAMPILGFVDHIKDKSQRTEGEVSGRITLRIPLSKKIKGKKTVKVEADLRDVGLLIPEWMVDFHRTNGQILVENNRISANALKTLYRGDKAIVEINTNNNGQSTEFALTGNLNSQNLASLLPDYLQKPITGKSDWKVQVSLANENTTTEPFIKMKASSDLVGTDFAFPSPFEVEKDLQKDFQFDGSLYKNDRLVFRANLDDSIVGRGEISLAEKSAVKVPALHLVFGREAKLKDGKGIHLSGFLENLNVNDWNEYIDSYFSEQEVDSTSILEQLSIVDLTLKQLTLANQQLTDTRLTLDNDGRYLSGRIDSSHARGKLRIPYQMKADSPLQADLDYFQLSKSRSKTTYKPDIKNMPNLAITSKVANLAEQVFNDFVLKTRNTGNTFIIDQLDFSRDDITLNASGQWQHEANTNEQFSVFNIAINGQDLGKTVSGLGLGESIRKGEIDFSGQIGWSGSLYDINWPTLIGEVNLNLTNGYLVNVEPGAGRFVGLLSFNALPKRLVLDFGDVVREGMQFKKISGSFTIKGETMTTDNARLDGPSAKIRIKGSSNLRAQTYDQSMIIIPKVGDTLPVLGSIAGGSSVGWGLLLLQKIFKKPIDKSVEIEYKLTGSWEEPEFTLVSKPQSESELESNDIFRD